MMKSQLRFAFVLPMLLLVILATSAFTSAPIAHASNLQHNAASHPQSIPCVKGGGGVHPNCGGCVSDGSEWDPAIYTATADNISNPFGPTVSLAEETNSATFTYHNCNRPTVTNVNCYKVPRRAVGSVEYCGVQTYGSAGIEVVQDSAVVFQSYTLCTLEDELGTDETGYQLKISSSDC